MSDMKRDIVVLEEMVKQGDTQFDEQIVCLRGGCARRFKPASNSHKFCSVACRRRATYASVQFLKTKYRFESDSRSCLACGRLFRPSGPKQECCNQVCRGRYLGMKHAIKTEGRIDSYTQLTWELDNLERSVSIIRTLLRKVLPHSNRLDISGERSTFPRLSLSKRKGLCEKPEPMDKGDMDGRD